MNTEILLNILGVQMLINCTYDECAKVIKKHFFQFLSSNWRSPDIIINCDLFTAERKLFRAIDLDNSLNGVDIYLPRKGKITEWHYQSPLIPPYYLPPFKDRFVGLHAAAVNIANKGALIIAGDRMHGKTTSALRLIKNFSNCSLLTDETVHIHRRSFAIEPFPISIHLCNVTEDKITKYSVSAENAGAISKFPSSVYQIIFLDKDIKHTQPEFIKVPPAETMKLLLTHHVDLGCNKDDAIHTLFNLSKHTPAVKFCYAHYHDLLNSIDLFKDVHE